MRTLEYGKEHEKTLLFLPCTAEPEWAFADSVGLLSQDYHVIQIVYDGHGETGEDFISVETTVDEVTDWLQARGITHLNAAYGCSLGGACLTRLLALGKSRSNHLMPDWIKIAVLIGQNIGFVRLRFYYTHFKFCCWQIFFASIIGGTCNFEKHCLFFAYLTTKFI